jgi:hypothetical protein
VYIWDIGSRQCSGRFIDDGCIWGSSIAVAPGSRFIACGARSGVVNVYETAGLLSSTNRAPKPAKILLNLTTSATAVKFNALSELMAMASDEKDNALRLVSFQNELSNWRFVLSCSTLFKAHTWALYMHYFHTCYRLFCTKCMKWMQNVEIMFICPHVPSKTIERHSLEFANGGLQYKLPGKFTFGSPAVLLTPAIYTLGSNQAYHSPPPPKIVEITEN